MTEVHPGVLGRRGGNKLRYNTLIRRVGGRVDGSVGLNYLVGSPCGSGERVVFNLPDQISPQTKQFRASYRTGSR